MQVDDYMATNAETTEYIRQLIDYYDYSYIDTYCEQHDMTYKEYLSMLDNRSVAYLHRNKLNDDLILLMIAYSKKYNGWKDDDGNRYDDMDIECIQFEVNPDMFMLEMCNK